MDILFIKKVQKKMNSLIKIINAYLRNKEISYFDKDSGIDYYKLLKEKYIETKEKENINLTK